MCSQPGQALCEGRDRTLLICSTWVLPWYSGRNLNEDYGGRKEAQLLYLLVACFKRRKPETGHIFTSSVKSSTMKADSGDKESWAGHKGSELWLWRAGSLGSGSPRTSPPLSLTPTLGNRCWWPLAPAPDTGSGPSTRDSLSVVPHTVPTHPMKGFYLLLASKALRLGTSLVVQWLGLHASTAESLRSIPGWDTEIPQALRCSPQKKMK